MEKLLLSIARCSDFFSSGNPFCDKIVLENHSKQLPEPWNGNILDCKILFISSNPSINTKEKYPTQNWNDQDIMDFFINRFHTDGRYVRNYLYPLLAEPLLENPYAKNWIRYWGYVRSISRELLGSSSVLPGIDYAMMEIVRCKSLHEYGVNEAIDHCVGRFLRPTLDISGAKLIVCVGDKAKNALMKFFEINLDNFHYQKIPHDVKNRFILCVPHANARKKRRLAENLSLVELNELRLLLVQLKP